MRVAARRNTAKRAVASGKSFTAPVGGWNARDALSDMKENEAVILDNWFPESSDLRLRGGFQEFADTEEAGEPVETLMNYTGLTSAKLFAAVNGSIYNCTAGGTIASADVTGLTSDRWQYTNYGNSAGNYLFACNGADTPRQYDGSAWSSMSLSGSGLTTSNLIAVNCFKERLFFLENNKLHFWYLPVNTISGAMTKFDLAPYCSLGGSLQAVATWSRDAGDGADDYIVFLTSEGEILIYKGTDPSSAADWALSSIYHVSKPIGRRCFMRIASELVVVTQDGIVPLSKVILYGLKVQAATLSDKINDAFSLASSSYGNNFGWEAVFYPAKHMAIMNVPIVNGSEQHQYVTNTTTGSWCRYLNYNANTFVVFDDELYFGGNDGKVYKAETGTSDDGANIETNALAAYSYFGARGKLKRWTLVRPVFRSTGNLTVSTRISVDFDNNLPGLISTADEQAGALWDVALWDVSYWSDAFRVTKNWRGATGTGYAAALGLRTSTKYQEIRWLSTDYTYELGGFV